MDPSDPVFRDIIDPNSARVRQQLIKRIQESLGTRLIVYVANPFHQVPDIVRHDVPPFEDLLRSAVGPKGCLMLNSPGGDANAAEKILMMCRQRFTGEFNVIVPDYAKSAATMIALGSDKIMMGYLAELGPIDPQLRTSHIPGGPVIPARSFIDGLNIIRKKVKEEGDPVLMYLPMLDKIRPEVLAFCQRALDDAREYAEKWLTKCMLREDPGQAKRVAEMLSVGDAYKSHGKVIDFDEAHDVLKLNVEKIDQNSSLWRDIWELYCRSLVHLQGSPDAAKLFESDSVSLTMRIAVRSRTIPAPAHAPSRQQGPSTQGPPPTHPQKRP